MRQAAKGVGQDLGEPKFAMLVNGWSGVITTARSSGYAEPL